MFLSLSLYLYTSFAHEGIYIENAAIWNVCLNNPKTLICECDATIRPRGRSIACILLSSLSFVHIKLTFFFHSPPTLFLPEDLILSLPLSLSLSLSLSLTLAVYAGQVCNACAYIFLYPNIHHAYMCTGIIYIHHL